MAQRFWVDAVYPFLHRAVPETKPAENAVQLGQLAPELDLGGVFQYCSVATRCKLRRVCHYWKHVACLPEISEVVFVDRSCLRVANPRRSRNRGNTELGWYHLTPDQPQHASLTDHRRHGILGPHVRVMIFDNAIPQDARAQLHFLHLYLDFPGIIYSIGFYCNNLQHLILNHFDVYDRMCDFGFSTPQPPSKLPALESVTFANSTVYVGEWSLPTSEGLDKKEKLLFELKRKLHYASVQTVRSTPPLCTAEEYSWVMKYAPSLPERYYKWALLGIPFCPPGTKRSESLPLPAVNLQVINPDNVKNHDVLQILTCCIMFEASTYVEWPPASLNFVRLNRCGRC